MKVLCFGEVEDLFEIEYKEREGFIVLLPDGKEIFLNEGRRCLWHQ